MLLIPRFIYQQGALLREELQMSRDHLTCQATIRLRTRPQVLVRWAQSEQANNLPGLRIKTDFPEP